MARRPASSWIRNTTALAIQRLCPAARQVLDCFTHTGSFALNAGIAGAAAVLGVDASELGVAQARENAELNGLSDRVTLSAAQMCSICCRSWNRRAKSLMWLFWIRRPSPNPAVLSQKRCQGLPRDQPARHEAGERTAAISPPAPAPTSWTRSCSPRPSARPLQTYTNASAR